MKTVTQQTRVIIPKVSVAMVTYNQEKYIAQAIESVLMQKTSFSIELVIGDDCSTDRTRIIVTQYAEQYKNLIRTLLPKRNLGAAKNYSAVISACLGEYIAYLEGDDYWTDASKLVRQVEMMDADPSMSFCFHRVLEFDESQKKERGLLPADDVLNFQDPVEELIRKNFIHSNSRMLRRSMIPVFDHEFENLKLGDWPASIMMAANGKMGFLPETMAAYRIHPESTWSSKGQDVRDFGTYEMFFYLFQRHLRPYESSIAKNTLRFSRLVLDHHRSQGLRHNIPFVITSLKISCQTGLPEIIAHLIWLIFYFIIPKRKGAWYEFLCIIRHGLIDPPSDSFVSTLRTKFVKIARLIPFANRSK